MKLTMAKCPCCDRRDTWTKAVSDPICGDCRTPMQRTSRLSVGRWHTDGVAMRPTRPPYMADLDHHEVV